MSTYFLTIDSPIGILKLASDETHLNAISFDAEPLAAAPFLPDVLFLVKKQLQDYFAGTRQSFDLPLDPQGTVFQKLVWKQLTEVHYGFTKSYVEIARLLGSENASRAVGMANGRNPIPLIIPCHRIIGQNGKLTGYAGGLERKKWLLLHEQKFGANGQLFF